MRGARNQTTSTSGSSSTSSFGIAITSTLGAQERELAIARVLYHTNSAHTLFSFRLALMHALRARGHEVVAVGPRDQYAEKIEAAGIRFVDVSMQMAGMNPFVEARVPLRLRRVYKRERPDLVHHFSLKPIIYGSFAARAAGVPHIVNTVTGLGYAFSKPGTLQQVVVQLLRTACRKRTWMTFQNPDDLARFERLRIVKASQAALIRGSGVDAERFRPAGPSPLCSGKGPVRFLMFSRMMWDKGVGEYLRAAAVLKSEVGERATFALLGGAPPGNPAGVHAEWLANPGTIPGEWLQAEAAKGYFTWFPHDDDVIPYLRNSDVVVLPSYYPEGVPRSLLEAMACGLAIVTTDSPGCREVVEEGVNGHLVAPRSIEDLASTMQRMIERPAVVAKMGEASRRLLLDRFSDEVVIRDTFEVYRRAGVPGF